MTLIKLQSIKMNLSLAQSSYNTPYQAHLKNKRLIESKRVKYGEIVRGHFSKITEPAGLPGKGARHGQ